MSLQVVLKGGFFCDFFFRVERNLLVLPLRMLRALHFVSGRTFTFDLLLKNNNHTQIPQEYVLVLNWYSR